jgi:serine/threonine-protein kinase
VSVAGSKKAGERVGGRYEIRALVRETPINTIYRAYDREIEIEVALRVIAPELLPDGVSRRAFIQKLSRARGLSHVGLLRVYDVAQDGDQVAVAVQWVMGPTLRDRIEKRAWGTPPLAADEARPILKQVRAALSHVHQLGLVLGDLRAETVMTLPEGVKLTNVGIGPALPRKRFLEAMRGAPAWSRLAPELRAGLQPDARADVYALALLTYEVLCGSVPDPQPRASAWVPPPLQQLLERALAEDPLLRPASAEQLGEDIERVLIGAPARVARRAESRPAPFVGEDTVPTPKIDPLLAHEEKTRVVDENELDRIRGLDVTRQVPEAEILHLRVQSSETQNVEMELEVPFEGESGPAADLPLEGRRDADGTFRGPLPRPGEHEDGEPLTERVHLLEPDAAKTTPVEKVDPAELVDTKPKVDASELADTKPKVDASELVDTKPKVDASETIDTKPIPRVEAIEFGDDALTNPVEKIDDEPVSHSHWLDGAVTDPSPQERILGAAAFPAIATPTAPTLLPPPAASRPAVAAPPVAAPPVAAPPAVASPPAGAPPPIPIAARTKTPSRPFPVVPPPPPSASLFPPLVTPATPA